MPVWNYQCSRCGDTIELKYRNLEQADEDTVRCQKCFGQMERQPSAPSFTIKGYAASNGYSEAK